ERVEKLDIIGSGKIDDLIRQNKINAKMASSLISDSLRTYHICKKLVFITNIIFLKENEFNILEKED
ncbi:MAG: Na/Pi cotransporter family protein, partial [Campylobacteraceae bacterium]|nr:Na/Pi cotransporter family protein [Campylobacteraceae bacterium]